MKSINEVINNQIEKEINSNPGEAPLDLLIEEEEKKQRDRPQLVIPRYPATFLILVFLFALGCSSSVPGQGVCDPVEQDLDEALKDLDAAEEESDLLSLDLEESKSFLIALQECTKLANFNTDEALDWRLKFEDLEKENRDKDSVIVGLLAQLAGERETASAAQGSCEAERLQCEGRYDDLHSNFAKSICRGVVDVETACDNAGIQ